MTDFQLRIIDVLTTPDEEYVRVTEQIDDKFDLLETLIGWGIYQDEVLES